MADSAASQVVKCPGCGKGLKAPAAFAGKKVKCGSCQTPIQLPPLAAASPAAPPINVVATPPTPPAAPKKPRASIPAAPAAPVSSPVKRAKPAPQPAAEPEVPAPKKLSARAQKLQQLLASFSGEFPRPSVSFSLRLTALLALVVLLLLPIIYLSIAAGVGWLTWWHATHSYKLLAPLRGRLAIAGVIIYATGILIGILFVFSMLRPLFRWRRGQKLKATNRRDEPLLYSFADRLADVVGSPRPDLIQFSPEINASAGYVTTFFGLGKRQFVLTLGLPLVAGLTVEQLAGIVAHEFGHFSQKGSMFLTRSVYQVDSWMEEVASQPGAADGVISHMTEGEMGVIVAVAGFLGWVAVSIGRGILIVLLYCSRIVTSALLRQMEFDADKYACGVVGGEAFESSMQRVVELSLAGQETFHFLSQCNDIRELPDDLPAFTAELATKHRKVKKAAKKQIRDQESSWLASHPPTRVRIEAAHAMELPGIFKCKEPARFLFHKFEGMCRSLTSFLYLVLTGDVPDEDKLKPSFVAVDEYVTRMGNGKEGI